MKKVLLFASAIALMTSCAKTEVGTGADEPEIKGIAFTADVESTDTKAEWSKVEGQWLMNWYAEQDRVSVYYKNAMLGSIPTTKDTYDTAPAEYKASRTAAGGYFVAKDDVNVINFLDDKDNTPANFYVAWPYRATTQGLHTAIIMPTGADNQIQSDLNGSSTVKNVFMITKNELTGTPVANGSASDALINMQLTRPFPVAYFKLKNYDPASLGILSTITLEAKGTAATLNSDGLPVMFTPNSASKLTYGDGATYDATNGVVISGVAGGNISGTGIDTDPVSKITLTTNTAQGVAPWTDETIAYMAIAKVDRSAMTADEWIEVVYEFTDGNMTSTIKTLEPTRHSWLGTMDDKGKGFIPMSGADGLDINAVPYIVMTNTSNVKTGLIINETCTSSLDAIVKAEAMIDASITKLVVKKELNSTDLAYLAKMTGLTDVTLMKNTKLAKGTFASVLTKLNAPMVTEIEKGFSTGIVALTDVILPSYPFGTNVDADNQLLKAASLVTLDASSCNSFAPVFPSIGISLQGFTKLTTIVVKNGVSVGANAFKGCILLTDVNFPKGVTGGAIKLVGNNAFDGCAKLTSISVDLVASNNTIPQGAFNACALLKVISHDGVTGFAPVKVGASAFEGCAVLETIDLSKATIVGAKAFKDCTALNGSKKIEGKDVMVVAVAKLEAGVFENCAGLKYLQFPNATEVVAGAMGSTNNNSTTLTQIEFMKAFTITTASPDALTFGTITTTDLFVKGDQTGVLANNTDIELGKTTVTKFTFKSIIANN